MKLKHIQQSVIIIGLLCCSLFAFAKDMALDITPDKVSVGESFRVTLTIHEQINARPDLSNLKKDFLVLGTSQSMQMTIINGRSSMISRWEIALLPKRAGTLIIPTIRIGRYSSPKTEIEVLAASQKVANRRSKKLFLRTRVDNKQPLVQSQLTYTIKLYYAADLSQGNIAEPEVSNAVVFRVGNDRQYQTRYKGRNYNVLERNYAIFPQKSGKFTIKPALFTGIEEVSNGGFVVQTRPARAVGKTISLNVQKIPTIALKHHWLPARELTVEEAWQIPEGEIAVGDPINRTLIIHAKGLTSAQLPEIAMLKLPGFNVYADKAVSNDTVVANQVIGQRKEQLAYIPTQSGKLTIPELKIYWWNTVEDRLEVITLSKREFTVSGASKASPQVSINKAKPAQISTSPISHEVDNTFTYVIAAVLAIWFVALCWWWLTGRKKLPGKQKQVRKAVKGSVIKPSAEKIKLSLKTACEKQKPKQARDALIQWAKLTFPKSPCRNLGDVSHKINDPTLRAALDDLISTLYADADTTMWDGKKLWYAFANYKTESLDKAAASIDDLPPLYPNY